MPKRYPPLTPAEVIAILLGLTRNEFYGSARDTARKMN
jgi:hypothetical protein